MIQVAVNDEFSPFEATLENNMKVVFIPPVAGG
jgi:molybdopterin converting factor small subunit